MNSTNKIGIGIPNAQSKIHPSFPFSLLRNINRLLFQFLCHASTTPQHITNLLIYMNNQVKLFFIAI